MFLDRNGEPLDVVKWGTLMEDEQYCNIALYADQDGLIISTIWLGIVGLDFKIFETMVQFRNGERQIIEKYASESSALLGHARWVSTFI